MRRSTTSNFKPAEPKAKAEEKSEFIQISNLFPSKKGNSFTVFLTEEILDKMKDLQANDLLGVTENKFGGFSLWYLQKGE